MTELTKPAPTKGHKNGMERPLLREVAYERLKSAIQVGELQPGEPLSELRLSELLKISRTPVREALQLLVQEGLVRNLPNRAMTVAAPSMQEILNVLHIRYLIDPEIARLVAESATKETIEVLQQSVEDLVEAARVEDRVRWSKADTLYHETLSNVCPNILLGQLGLQMRNRTHLVAVDVQTTPARLEACSMEHQNVVDAIAQRDGKTAQEAMRQHIHHLRESFFRRLTHV